MSVNEGSVMKKIIITSAAIILALILPTIALAATYVGNRSSCVFHYQGCQAERKMKPQNKIFFSSRTEAVAYGMRSCGICRP